jgi:hypothetical protein
LGTFAGLQSLSLLLASVWAGLLWDFTGPMMVFLITAGLTVPVGLYFAVGVREDKADFEIGDSAGKIY